MKSIREAEKEFERRIRDLPREQKMAERARFAALANQERQRRIDAVADEERAAQQGSIPRRIAGNVVAGGMNAANTATFGRLPQIAGALPGGDRERMETALGASQQTNPIASTVGSFAGLLSPGSLSNVAMKAGGRALSAATGATKLTEATLAAPFLQRAAAQSAQNVISATGAIGTFNLLESREDGAGLAGRLAKTAEQVKSPLTLGLAVGGGALAAKFTRPPEAQFRDLFARYRQITGKQIPASVVQDSVELHKAIDTMARAPGMAKHVERARREFLTGTRQIVQEIGRRGGAPAGQTAERAAAGVVRARGTDAIRGTVRAARQDPERTAFAAESSNRISRDTTMSLIRNLRDVMTGSAGRAGGPGPITPLSKADPRGSEMTGILSDFSRVVRSGKVTVNDLEALRKRLGDGAWGFNRADPGSAQWSSRGRSEAAGMYDAVVAAMETKAPTFVQAMRNGEKLRRMEEALSEAKVSNVAETTLRAFWSGQKPLDRWRAIKDRGTPEDVGALRGWYFDSLIRASELGNGTVSASKLQKLLARPGMFNSQVMDDVLPGVRQDLVRMASIYERAAQGLTKAEGSQTAGRGMFAAASAGGVGLIVAAMTNPYSAAAAALKATGALWLVKRLQQSIVSGAVEQRLSQLGQGQVTPMGPLPAAIQQQGGLSGLGGAALGGVRELGETTGQAVGAALGGPPQ